MTKELPKRLYRPDDLESFVLVGDKYFREDGLLSWPDNYHHKYSYDALISHGFLTEPKLKAKTREEHIAEFWKSFYESIQLAHGNISRWNGSITLQEVADELAQNGIRFKYERRT
jgi:hypothetical protein